MAIEMLKCARTGQWSSHAYLLPDRWPHAVMCQQVCMPWPFLPYISWDNSNNQDSCHSEIRVFFAQRKILGRCFLQINILSSYLISSTILDVRADKIASLFLWSMHSIEGKRTEYHIRQMCSKIRDNEHYRENHSGALGCTNADNFISLILGL